MKRVYKRNTGRTICRMSFIDEQKNFDKLETYYLANYNKASSQEVAMK